MLTAPSIVRSIERMIKFLNVYARICAAIAFSVTAALGGVIVVAGLLAPPFAIGAGAYVAWKYLCA